MRFPKPVRNLVITMFCGALLFGMAPVSAAEEGAAAPNPALLDPSLAKETHTRSRWRRRPATS